MRLGGIGISNPTKTAEWEHNTSIAVTENLTNIICNQETDFINYDEKQVQRKIMKEEYDRILTSLDDKIKRAMELTQEKGSCSWLTDLPIKSLGYSLNKPELHNSLCLRYVWKVPNTHNYCQYGAKNDIDHALSCKKKGGGVYHWGITAYRTWKLN